MEIIAESTNAFGPVAGFVIAILLAALGILWRRSEEKDKAHKIEITAYNKLYLELFEKLLDVTSRTNTALEQLETQRRLSDIALDHVKKEIDHD